MLQAGCLAGLEAWAWRDECRELQALRELCRSNGLPLIVLGPTASLITPGLRALGERLDRRGAGLFQRWGVPYCSLPGVEDASGTPYYGVDRVHLTAAGHGYVARQLRAALGRVMSPSSRSHLCEPFSVC